MSCDECDKEQDRVLYGEDGHLCYFRVGDKESGWANVMVVACEKHLLLVQRALRKGQEE
jgi:hypothetical protein